MKRISKIEFVNYKAFLGDGESNQILIENGNNVLIYGENGSGKSSIYEGIKQFFNSAENSYQLRPQRNIYAPLTKTINAGATDEHEEPVESSVKVTFKDGDIYQTKTFGYPTEDVRHTDFALKALQLNGFLSYKELLGTYLLENTKDRAVFRKKFADLLIEQILANKINSATQRKYKDDWDYLFTAKAWYKNETLKKFEIGFINDIRKINLVLNEVLSHFDPKLEVEIEHLYSEIDYYHTSKKDRTGNYPLIEVDLIVKYNGLRINSTDENHLTVLNEAKLSSLAISIYLAAIIVTPQEHIECKILFLDDIFIGLDMSNRLPLLNILTEFKKPLFTKEVAEEGPIVEKIKVENGVKQYEDTQFFKSYQIFVTTYDRHWYEIAKDSLGKDWTTIEIYVGEGNKPVIFNKESDLFKKALKHFKAFDYNAAGNSLRRAIEKKLHELVPKTYTINAGDLNELIAKLFAYYDENACGYLINNAIRNQIILFKDVILNPSSHYDLKSPLYKVEIEKAIEIYKALEQIPKIARELVLGMRTTIFYKNPNKSYKAKYLLRENLYLIKLADGTRRLTDPLHQLLNYSKDSISFCKKGENVAYDAAQIESFKASEIRFSERINKIKFYLDLPAAENVDLSNFTLTDGKSINELIVEL